MILTVGEGRQFQTIGAAIAAASDGDVIRIEPGTYREALDIDKSVTIEPAGDNSQGAVVLDGGYGPHLYGDGVYTTSKGRPVKGGELPALTPGNAARGRWAYAGKLSERGYSALVTLSASGATVHGLTLRNAPGRFVVFDSDGGVVSDCRMDFCYGGAVRFSSNASENELTNCVISRSSVKAHDPGAPGAGPASVATTVIDGGNYSVIKRNVVCYCYGEGISADKESEGALIMGNIVFGCAHWGIGINGAARPRIEGNVVYWPDNVHEALGKSGPADCFVVGSEQASLDDPRKALTPNAVIRNNLFVGGKRAFVLGSTGRPVQFVHAEIDHNTIVGRVVSAGVGAAAMTWTCLPNAPHVNTKVTDNVVIWQAGRDGVSYQPGGEVIWLENVYSVLPSPGMRGAGDVTAAVGVLNDPFARIEGTYLPYSPDMPDVTTTFDINNYRPIIGGAAVGRGALEALPDEPEPEPDYAPIIGMLERHLTNLEYARSNLSHAGLSIDAGIIETHELIDRLKAGQAV